ncbi:MAG: hypothetical protein QOI02_1734 [Actinomycetota bacterium]|nr:hypothetical protein [Actinomycetota bacterium]
MAEGRSNNGIASQLVITEGAVEKTFAAFWRNFGYPRPGMVTGACSLF